VFQNDGDGWKAYKTVNMGYCGPGKISIFCYDVTDSNSFSSIERWLKFVDDYAPTDVNKLLVGNKLDVGEEQRMVPQRLGKVGMTLAFLFKILNVFCIY
jgi:GTPase SAR1 family protein